MKAILTVTDKSSGTKVGKYSRCVFCQFFWFNALFKDMEMKGKICALGHRPRCYQEKPPDPRWVEYRRICKDFIEHKDRKRRATGRRGKA